jgi:CspA family cold shock protein
MYDRRTDLDHEDTSPVHRIEAKVKWFNASKGFGFVTMADGSPDAFLPMAILRRAGYEDVREGASITCEVGPSSSLEGAVKWFEPDKGYGFISPDGGGKDVFIHITALRRSGLEGLAPGQRVRVEVIDGRKGLEADSITLV